MWAAAAGLAVAVALGAAVVWAERRALLAGHGNGKPAFHKVD